MNRFKLHRFLIRIVLFLNYTTIVSTIKSKTKSYNNSNTFKNKSKPNKMNIPAPLRPPPVQEDFLISPADFEKDEDVRYLVKHLHHPQVIEKFYTTAQIIHSHLPIFYTELQNDDFKVADQFLLKMKKLTTASFQEPLTVTNLIFACVKHLHPLFKFQSEPLTQLTATLGKLESEKDRRMIHLMTRFFDNFTLPEVSKIQDFIRLMSLSTLQIDHSEFKESIEKSVNTKQLDHGDLSETKTSGSSKSHQFIDISKTSLGAYSELIQITLSNALSKMIILLDLFVTDPTAALRSHNLVIKLWDLHLHRLALRQDIPFEDLDPKWLEQKLYRKSAVHFSFEDWSPDGMSEEAMDDLRSIAAETKVAAASKLHPIATKNITSLLLSSSTVIVFVIIFVILLLFISITLWIRFRQQQNEINSVDTDSINELVLKLETDVDIY